MELNQAIGQEPHELSKPVEIVRKNIIEVEGLVKRYGNITAVDGLSFSVGQGEIFGLLGPNGAGKTTTLEIIETLREKTEGRVSVCGFDLDKNASEIKKRIGVQLQAAGYYPGLHLRELIDLFSGLYGMPSEPDRLLGLVGLQDKEKAKFKELSGGQKQRFSIATTLINRPEIIFLDEPTTGLDPQARRNLWDLILGLRNEGATVVITTHYMDEAEVLCDRVGIINKGKLVSLAPPAELISNLLASGYTPQREVRSATLEDVFLHETGESLNEEAPIIT